MTYAVSANSTFTAEHWLHLKLCKSIKFCWMFCMHLSVIPILCSYCSLCIMKSLMKICHLPEHAAVEQDYFWNWYLDIQFNTYQVSCLETKHYSDRPCQYTSRISYQPYNEVLSTWMARLLFQFQMIEHKRVKVLIIFKV